MGWMTGFEPATFWATTRRANQLRHNHHLVYIRYTIFGDLSRAIQRIFTIFYLLPYFFRSFAVASGSTVYSLRMARTAGSIRGIIKARINAEVT